MKLYCKAAVEVKLKQMVIYKNNNYFRLTYLFSPILVIGYKQQDIQSYTLKTLWPDHSDCKATGQCKIFVHY